MVMGLDRPNFRVITTHCYNPFVTDQQLALFLGKFGEVTSTARYMNDPWGIWTGRRQFQVLLHQDPGGHEGLKHPPAYFSLGVDRGYLYYARQPPFCRRCRTSGHTEAGCAGALCRFCGLRGHEAKECPSPKACHGCGQQGHLLRGCPSRRRTFAEAAAGGERATAQVRPAGGDPGQTMRPLEEVVKEIQEQMERVSGAHMEEGVVKSVAASDAEVSSGTGGSLETTAAGPSHRAPVVMEVERAAVTSPRPTAAKRLRGVKVVEGREGRESGEEGGGKKVRGDGRGGQGGEQGVGETGPIEGEMGGALRDDGVGLLVQVGGGEGGGVLSPAVSEASVESAGQGLEMDLSPALVSLSSPLGVDAYEGSGRPSTSPNTDPYSWAEETAGFYGDLG